jgi:hypothetical protein
MNLIHVRCQTEIDYQRLIAFFETEQIPHRGQELDSKVFPVGNEGRYFGEITIPGAYQDQVQTLLQEIGFESFSIFIEQSPEQWRSQKPQKVNFTKFMAWAMTATTLVTSVLAVKYWRQAQLRINPNFRYEWSLDNTRYHQVDKKTDAIITTFSDANWNNNFESITSYWTDGSISNVATDKDENGYFELSEAYAKDGKRSNMVIDLDGDGDFDYSETYLDNNEVIRFTDSDKNGRWEIASKPLK